METLSSQAREQCTARLVCLSWDSIHPIPAPHPLHTIKPSAAATQGPLPSQPNPKTLLDFSQLSIYCGPTSAQSPTHPTCFLILIVRISTQPT